MNVVADATKAELINLVREAWKQAGVKPKIVPEATVLLTSVFDEVGILTSKVTGQDGREQLEMEIVLPGDYADRVVHQPWAQGWKRAIVLDGQSVMRYPEVEIFAVRVARPSKGFEVRTGTTYVAVRDGQKVATGSSKGAARGRAKAAGLTKELEVLLPTLGPDMPMCAQVRCAGDLRTAGQNGSGKTNGVRWFLVRQKSEDLWQMLTVHQSEDGRLGSPYAYERKGIRSAIYHAWRWMGYETRRDPNCVVFNNLPPVPKTQRALKEEEAHQSMVRNLSKMQRNDALTAVLL